MLILFLYEIIDCGYSLEVPNWGASNEWPQHMFFFGELGKISTIFGWKNKCLISSCTQYYLHDFMNCVLQLFFFLFSRVFQLYWDSEKVKGW